MIGFCSTPLETFSGMDIWLGHLTSFEILLPGLSLHLLPVFYLWWSSLGNRRTLLSALRFPFSILKNMKVVWLCLDSLSFGDYCMRR